jgi:hypothetical protein
LCKNLSLWRIAGSYPSFEANDVPVILFAVEAVGVFYIKVDTELHSAVGSRNPELRPLYMKVYVVRGWNEFNISLLLS